MMYVVAQFICLDNSLSQEIMTLIKKPGNAQELGHKWKANKQKTQITLVDIVSKV